MDMVELVIFLEGSISADIQKSIDFMDLVKLLSSSRRSDRVYQDQCACDLVEELLQKQCSRQSVKTQRDFYSVGSYYGFQVCL